jgi:nucleotide-binding universal stress UspA family protein
MVREKGRCPMRSLDSNAKNHSVFVVGYDGTDPAQRALLAAAGLSEDSAARVEVVFVAHMPVSVAFSAQAVPAARDGLDEEAQDLERQVEETLASRHVKWHFERRNGEIAPELLAACEEQLASGGPETRVMLIVGCSAHKIDRYLNSVPAKVIRHDRFEVLVVP